MRIEWVFIGAGVLYLILHKGSAMYKLLPSTDIRFLRSELTRTIDAVDAIIRFHCGPNTEWYITSGRDGTSHKQGSKHYINMAYDFDVVTWTNAQRAAIRNDVSKKIGPDYDVIDEGTHIHLEFDPKA